MAFIAAYPSNYNAYTQMAWHDLIYAGLDRIVVVTGAMIILYSVFSGHLNIGTSILKNNYCRSFGKLTFLQALVGPIVITYIYCGVDYAVLSSGNPSTYFAVGHIVTNLIVGTLLFLFVEYPVSSFIRAFISRNLSHNDLLRLKSQENDMLLVLDSQE